MSKLDYINSLKLERSEDDDPESTPTVADFVSKIFNETIDLPNEYKELDEEIKNLEIDLKNKKNDLKEAKQ